MSNLSKERLSIAIGSAAACRRALSITLNYVHGREMFGGVLAQLQSVQQKLAQLRLEIQLVTTFVDECIAAQAKENLSAETASMAKVAATELASKVADVCLQLHVCRTHTHTDSQPPHRCARMRPRRVRSISVWSCRLPHPVSPSLPTLFPFFLFSALVRQGGYGYLKNNPVGRFSSTNASPEYVREESE